MSAPPVLPLTPQSVSASVDAIQSLSIVPTVLETVCRVTGMRFAAVARVTDDRWTTCAVLDHLNFGLHPGSDLELESTICSEIRQHQQPVIFAQASQHPVFSTHRTPRIYGLESYVSVPILTKDGTFFGTLCAIDSAPQTFDETTVVGTLTLFAALIASHLALEHRAVEAEHALRTEIDTGVLREQFLAVVGHDLRSPLQGARLATEELDPLQGSERGRRLVTHLARSLSRMSGLIDDIMDFARGRLGTGIPVALVERGDFTELVQAAVEEIRLGHPHCQIDLTLQVSSPVRCDGKRLHQLLANLLNNAVTHGDRAQRIEVRATDRDTHIAVAVTNQGPAIPEATLIQLFEPFVRPESSAHRPGLGLGLYIAAEIARGHEGDLTVSSCPQAGTTFTLTLPKLRGHPAPSAQADGA